MNGLPTGVTWQATLLKVNDTYGRAYLIAARLHSFTAINLDPKLD